MFKKTVVLNLLMGSSKDAQFMSININDYSLSLQRRFND